MPKFLKALKSFTPERPPGNCPPYSPSGGSRCKVQGLPSDLLWGNSQFPHRVQRTHLGAT